MAERTELMVSVETADYDVYVVTAEVTQTYDTSKGLCVESGESERSSPQRLAGHMMAFW